MITSRSQRTHRFTVGWARPVTATSRAIVGREHIVDQSADQAIRYAMRIRLA
ncbi:hypothetical protein [Nonomuraea fuscirosea]|uniref:hypothetical protein n=1 Tax=Nonomuraea fuscirosea TaxID=1291556 RepID=UPI00341D4E29